MFEPAKEAGISPSELSRLLQVSRVTASLWLNGHARPHHLHEHKIQRVLLAIRRATKKGKLPLSPDIHRTERDYQLSRAVLEALEEIEATTS